MPEGDRRSLAVVDIDGVVADVRHRLHHLRRRPKDWSGFFAAAGADPPHPEGIAVVERLAAEHDVVFLSGRPESLRKVTARWLADHGLGDHPLHLRPSGDGRPAARMKLDQIARIATGRRIAMVVDDDESVIAAARAAGLPTFHATWEARAHEDQRTLHRAQETEGRT